MQPRVIDNDKGVITVNVNGHRVRDWIYANDDERRRMMSEARWYVEGWCDGREAA
jgi:dTDP-D-glucose 4,6-dehydratase